MSNSPNRQLLIATLRRLRVRGAVSVEPTIQAIRAEMFAEQLAFVDDPSREKAANGTRRCGKTGAEERYGPLEALKHPGSLIRYWAITRQRCKELMWLPLKYLLERHHVAAKTNDSELRIFLSNRSEIRLVGADKDKEAQKKRGDKTRLEIVMEAQSFGPFLKTLIEDVVDPCLFDLRGTKALDGTPGPIPAGHWFSVTGSKPHETAKRWISPGRVVGGALEGQGWSCHRWSVLDNPHLPHAAEELKALQVRRGWDDNHPTYLREWLARWVSDSGALFYAFDESRNLHHLPEEKLRGPGWVHVLGWDLGHRDDMGKVVLAFHPDSPDIFEAFSWKKPGAGLDECASIDEELHRRFNIIARVADTGGGGAMFVAEHARRWPGHFYEAAKKTEKYAHVLLLNDDLRAGRLKLREGSPLHQEMSTLPKDPDWPDEKVPREDPRFPNHCCDPALYAWRRAYHFFHEKEEVRPPPGSPEAHEAEAVRMEQAELRAFEQQSSQPWWEQT